MAKVTITADTETDELEVAIGGEVVPNVRYISISYGPTYEDPLELEVNVNISTYEEDEANDVKRYTTLIAKDTKPGKEAVQAGAKLHKKYREFAMLHDSNKFKKDIAEYFGV
jgi:hypothetical protein